MPEITVSQKDEVALLVSVDNDMEASLIPESRCPYQSLARSLCPVHQQESGGGIRFMLLACEPQQPCVYQPATVAISQDLHQFIFRGMT
ncbi:uncharacterized [Tachysurus ichikawai]